MSNDNKLTGEAWGLFRGSSLVHAFHFCEYLRARRIAIDECYDLRRIRWETTDDPKGTEQ